MLEKPNFKHGLLIKYRNLKESSKFANAFAFRRHLKSFVALNKVSRQIQEIK